jgi:hypothetical protein
MGPNPSTLLLINKGRTLTQVDDGQRRSFPLAVGVGEGKDEGECGGEGTSTAAREGAHRRGQGRAERRHARGGGHGRHGYRGGIQRRWRGYAIGRTWRHWLRLGGTICRLQLESKEKLA